MRAVPLHVAVLAAALALPLGAQDAPPPLASLASTRMIVLPVQSSRSGGLLEWGRALGGPRGVEATFDSIFANAVAEQRLDANWIAPDVVSRSARRNPTYATDPAAIRAGDAVRLLERNKKGNLAEPVASQLRTLVGLNDARHALVPVEVRFDAAAPDSAGGVRGIATLHLGVLDVRAGRLLWVGDVSSEPHGTPRAALVQLAERFTFLVIPR